MGGKKGTVVAQDNRVCIAYSPEKPAPCPEGIEKRGPVRCENARIMQERKERNGKKDSKVIASAERGECENVRS